MRIFSCTFPTSRSFLPRSRENVRPAGRWRHAAVHLSFHGPFDGTTSLVFSQDSANKLVDILTGQGADDGDFDEVKRGVLSEVGNIVVNGVMGSISNMLECRLNYSIPSYIEEKKAIRSVLRERAKNQVILLGHARFCVTEHVIPNRDGELVRLSDFRGKKILLITWASW